MLVTMMTMIPIAWVTFIILWASSTILSVIPTIITVFCGQSLSCELFLFEWSWGAAAWVALFVVLEPHHHRLCWKEEGVSVVASWPILGVQPLQPTNKIPAMAISYNYSIRVFLWYKQTWFMTPSEWRDDDTNLLWYRIFPGETCICHKIFASIYYS